MGFKIMDDDQIETMLQEKGLNAPRLSPTMIAEQVISEQYYIFPSTVLTVCCLTLKNGFNVVGKSAPVSAQNFNEEVGRTIARKDAMDQIWALEGYLLKSKLNKTL
jgi:hypothetical protein